MALYEITAPDGTVYEIEGPENASHQSLILAAKRYERQQRSEDIQRRFAEARNRPEPPPETTFGGNVKEFFKGVIPGAVGLAETAGTGLAAMLPEDTEKAARDKLKEIAGIAKKPFEAGAGYEESVGRKLGEGIGSLLPVAPLALLGPAGVAGGVGVGLAAGAGEARERAEREGATGEQRRTATGLGMIPGGFDTAIDMALAAFPGGAGKAISVLKRAMISGGVEGATEAAQEIAQNAIAKGVYKPGQELLVGSGEAGATGAGVGVLASLILDAAIRGRRRGPTPAPATGEGAPPPPETKPLETKEPFTPVVAPNGAVLTTREEYDAYLKSQEETARQREEDLRTSDRLAGLTPAERDFARRSKEAGLAQAFAQEPEKGQMGLPGFERADGTVEVPGRGRITPQEEVEPQTREEAQRAESQLGLDLQGGMTIDDIINEMYAAEARAPEEAKRKEAEEAKRKEAEKARLKFESDMAETDARLQRTREKTTEDKRLEVLLPVIESDARNIPKVFAQKLKQEGFANTNLTERERNLINRAYDIRLMQEPEPEQVPAPKGAEKELRTLESLVAEKPAAREPEQLGFPGMGKPKGAAPQAFSEEELAQQEKPFATKLSADVLAQAGLPKQSGFYKQLLDMDMADPAQQPVVAHIFSKVRANPNVSQGTKDAIERMAMQAFGGLAKQKEMFGPRGGVAKEEQRGPRRGTTVAADVAGRDRTRPEGGEAGVGPGRGSDTGRTEAPKPAGLAGAGRPAAGAGEGKGKPSGAVEAPGKAETKPDVAWWNAWSAGQKPKGDVELPADMVRVFSPLSPAIVDALRAGDLSGALMLLSKQLSGKRSKFVAALADALKGVRVSIATDLKSSSGRSLAGSYDPKAGLIRLDGEKGLNPHALLHEAVHAAVLKELSNKTNPLTKQLTELFDTIKDSLNTAYGATSLDEFVSEAISNPDFQRLLSQINPMGAPVSAWKRFVNAVGNFLRRLVGAPTRGIGSAMDAADSLISALIAPTPDALGAGSLYEASLLGTAEDVFRAIDQQIISLPGINNRFVGGIYEFLRSKIPDTTKNLVLSSLPLSSLTEVASREIPMAKRLDVLERQLNGAVEADRQKIDGTMRKIQAWLKGDPKREALLNDVIAESTIAEVDPSRPLSDYKGKKTRAGESKEDIWKALQPKWDALKPEGQAIYKQMRDSYTQSYERLLDLLLNRITTSVKNPEEAKKLRTEVYQRLVTRGRIEPYFPLMRQGDFWVEFSAKSPEGNMEFYKMAFNTSVEREVAIRELKATVAADNTLTPQQRKASLDSIRKTTPTAKRDYKSAPSTSFVNSMLKVLEANKVDAEVTNEIIRVFLDTLPESSFAQSFRKRLNTLGFEKDATKTFYTKSINMAHQMGNLGYGAKMYQLRDEMEEHVAATGSTPAAQMMFNALDKQIKSIIAPNIAPWAKASTALAFNWTLGGNISSALVNLTQLPMVVMPYLGGQYGFSEANRAIGAATRAFLGSGRKRKIGMTGSKDTLEVGAGYSIDNYDFAALEDKKKKGTLTKEEEATLDLKELSAKAAEYGMLSRSVANDTLEAAKNDTLLSRVNSWTGFMFHHGERMNRQVSMIAAYKLELDKLRKTKKDLTAEDREAAAQEAIRLTDLLNGGASANSAPLIAKNSVGKMLFMYKRYGVSMYYMLFKTTRDAMVAEDPEVRKAAKRQIAGIYAMTALLSGVQGLPMFGVMAAMYNLFFKEDDEDDAETAARKYLGEAKFNGALNYFTGTAIASRIGLSDLLLHSTGYKDQDNALLSIMQLAGGPVYGVADRIARGAKLIADGNTERGLEQMAPAAVGNVLKAARYATEGATTLRGDPITGDIGAGHALAQAFGFAPAEYTRQLEVNAASKNIERRVTEKKTKLLREYYMAIRNGDGESATESLQELLKIGAKYPGMVTADTIRKSMQQHMRTTASMQNGITLNRNMRAALMANAAEFDPDVTIFHDERE